jgi:hypothetical protein
MLQHFVILNYKKVFKQIEEKFFGVAIEVQIFISEKAEGDGEKQEREREKNWKKNSRRLINNNSHVSYPLISHLSFSKPL